MRESPFLVFSTENAPFGDPGQNLTLFVALVEGTNGMGEVFLVSDSGLNVVVHGRI